VKTRTSGSIYIQRKKEEKTFHQNDALSRKNSEEKEKLSS
jgi:hypothetical protein